MNTLDEITAMHRASVVKVEAAKATHKTIREHINAALVDGLVAGVPFKIGDQVEATGEQHRGKLFTVENITLQRIIWTGKYFVQGTGRIVLKKSGLPGKARSSIRHNVD